MENHPQIRDRAIKRTEFLARHDAVINDLHMVGLKLIIKDFETQTTAAETTSLVFGTNIGQSSISKALSHGKSVAKIHIQLALAYQEFRECAMTTDCFKAIQRYHGIFPRHHQLCEHIESGTPLLYRGGYQTGGTVRLITVDVEGVEHHYKPDELEFF
ncbi:hypothetical protein K6U51_12380 [Vibrio fluvialis]|uniref:hypothetical protein n=1 Tax=Vibrio fluvialis TaxID=676 RepID=UPI001EE9F941|nr:hypothetical protein [Vibrio fluvialis]MCG6387543.1 hypothetical protein [Vibrio fluvialis]MCG6418830.1 hypothetical protein [Vibrio fluvialis]